MYAVRVLADSGQTEPRRPRLVVQEETRRREVGPVCSLEFTGFPGVDVRVLEGQLAQVTIGPATEEDLVRLIVTLQTGLDNLRRLKGSAS